MRRVLCTLPLLAALCVPALAAQESDGTAGLRGVELREAVEAQRNSTAGPPQRDVSTEGRRLTAAERLELREQLRRQWLAPPHAPRPAHMQPEARIAPVPSSSVRSVADAQSSRILPAVAQSQRP
jgi:hypothetical protein